MSDLLHRIETKIDKLDDRLDNVDKTMAIQETHLREHIRRTELLEKGHTHMEAEFHNELEPIKEHVNKVRGVTKAITYTIPIVVSIVLALWKWAL